MILSNLTTTVAGVANSYTAAVGNSGGTTISSAGVLTVTFSPYTVTGVSLSGGNVVMSFTSDNSYDTTNAFILQSSGDLLATFTNTPGTFTLTGGVFSVTATNSSDAQMFYRLMHAP